MKALALLGITVMAIGSMSCASVQGDGLVCPSLEIQYLRAETRTTGGPIGVFSVENIGQRSAELPMGNENGEVHGRFADIEERDASGGAWRKFNPLLDEMVEPISYMKIDPRQKAVVLYDGNGVFHSTVRRAGVEFSVVFVDRAGCSFRSTAFSL